MRSKITLLFLVPLALALPLLAAAADSAKAPDYIDGPTKVKLEKVASVDVPEGFKFLDAKHTRAWLKARGEKDNENMMGMIRPTDTNKAYAVFFKFADIGYVKDTDKDDLAKSADKLLSAYKRGTAEANKERERNG